MARARPIDFNKLTYDQAMALARYKGLAVRCDYMGPGWKIRWIAKARGYFNINPHTGSEYHFTPQKIDTTGVWRLVK